MSKKSYAMRMISAQKMDDKVTFCLVADEAMSDMSQKLTRFVNSYDKADLPLIVAAMKTVSRSLEAMLGKDGLEWVRAFENDIQGIIILQEQRNGGTE